MNFQKINERLLSHPGARKEFHEKWGWMVYWVGEKQFACEFVAAPNAKAPYAGRHLLSLKCNPERIIELRNEFPEDILPGYYSDGRTWISIDLESDVPDGLVLDLCDKSYALVFSKLTKKSKGFNSYGVLSAFREITWKMSLIPCVLAVRTTHLGQG